MAGHCLCIYCNNFRRHPHYMLVLSDNRCNNNPKKHKVVPYITFSVAPLRKLLAENRAGKQYGRGSQLTKAGAPHYQIELVFGPLFGGATPYKETCRHEARKIKSRLLRFCNYARDMMKNPKCKAMLYARDPAMIRRLYENKANELKRNK